MRGRLAPRNRTTPNTEPAVGTNFAWRQLLTVSRVQACGARRGLDLSATMLPIWELVHTP